MKQQQQQHTDDIVDNESAFILHAPCNSCGSSDGEAQYSDGHTYCFVCRKYTKGDNTKMSDSDSLLTTTSTKPAFSAVGGRISALAKRGLTEETCQKWGYKVGDFNGKPVQVADYYDTSGCLVAQKLRFPNKDFMFLGDSRAAGLYGQQLWRDGGKMVVITEGEIDALSVSQLQGNKWPVVSLPSGAQGAVRALRKSVEWLEKFEKVILMFDMDEHGRKAANDCAQLLSVGKAHIASLPLKDANECLVAGKGAEVITAIWNAKQYRPDGIVGATEMWDSIVNQPALTSVPYPWNGLNQVVRGIRQSEIVTVTAGSGIGKSQVCREIAHHLLAQGHSVGYVALEESVRRTALGIVGIELNQLIHIDQNLVSPSELKEAFDRTIGTGRFFTYDHFGSIDSENLMNRIRYMVRGCGCQYIVLDHLSIVVSGLGDGDERRLIDNTMTKLRALVQELQVGMILVSHLKRPDGKGHEEGAATSLSQLRGSASIAQLSDIVLGMERNQQDPDSKNISNIRVLKNRFTGETGLASSLKYDKATGRMSEVDSSPIDSFADVSDKEFEEGDGTAIIVKPEEATKSDF